MPVTFSISPSFVDSFLSSPQPMPSNFFLFCFQPRLSISIGKFSRRLPLLGPVLSTPLMTLASSSQRLLPSRPWPTFLTASLHFSLPRKLSTKFCNACRVDLLIIFTRSFPPPLLSAQALDKIIQDFLASIQDGDIVDSSAILIRMAPHFPAPSPPTDTTETLNAMLARESLVPRLSTDSLAALPQLLIPLCSWILLKSPSLPAKTQALDSDLIAVSFAQILVPRRTRASFRHSLWQSPTVPSRPSWSPSPRISPRLSLRILRYVPRLSL